MNYPLSLQISLTVIATMIYLIGNSAIRRAIKTYGREQNYLEKRIVYTKKFFSFIFFLVLFAAITVIWGIDIKGVLIFTTSFFAIVGIALFASWSILSNITSSIIIFFSFPYKIGDDIRISDGENSIEGKIRDMTFFHIKIEDKDKNLIFYPNNLAIQKPVLKIHKA